MSVASLFSQGLFDAGCGLFLTFWGAAKLFDALEAFDVHYRTTQLNHLIFVQEVHDGCGRCAPQEDCDQEDEIRPVEGESKFE